MSKVNEDIRTTPMASLNITIERFVLSLVERKKIVAKFI